MGLTVHSNFNKLIKVLEKVKDQSVRVKVGFSDLEDVRIASDLSVGIRGPVTYASRHGNGPITVQGIPPRPFLKDSMSVHVSEIERMAKKYYNNAMRSNGIAVEVGERAVSIVQDFMDNEGPGMYTGNAPVVVADKGFNHPLVDTGHLRDSITFELEYI